MKLKEVLKEVLSEEEVKLLPSSFDIIGSREKAVAIIEIPKELEKKKEIIGNAIMEINKNVKSVLRKISERKGKFRLKEYELICGEKNTEVLHKEYGCLFKLDPKKVYFSPREATERQRIANQVKANELVMIMFSGIMPFGIIIAKVQPKVRKVIGIELNPVAHEYAKENVRINKVSHLVIPILGDVREKCVDWYEKCDRVIMPLPFGGEDFLDIGLKCVKKGIIHFYYWGEKGKLFVNAIKIIKETVKKVGKNFEIINKRKVLPYAPKKYKVCIEFRVW